MGTVKRWTALLLAFANGGCAAPARARPGPSFWGALATPPSHAEVRLRDVTAAEWSLARARLTELRGTLLREPYVERVRVSLFEPFRRTSYEARGAVAVDPEHAVRMILLGPGGTTAIDLWVTEERYRFLVPAVGSERKGARRSDDAQGLPVAFFRWWFLSPLRGRLLAANATGSETSWLLKDGAATILLRGDGTRFFAMRREGEREEGLAWHGDGLAPVGGSRARYVEGRHGLRVDVDVEAVETTPPPSDAFTDPEASP